MQSGRSCDASWANSSAKVCVRRLGTTCGLCKLGSACLLALKVHASRQWFQDNIGHVDKILVKVDFRNAFNSVSRQAMLRASRSRLPEVAPWADWCYGVGSELRFGEHTVQSSSGVQQGGPLGPLLFALSLQRALATASESACLDLCFAFLDPGLCGPACP